MKTRYLPAIMLAALLGFFSCTSAPESDETKTTEAKDVTESKAGETWKLNVSDSKIEWIGTKVSGYHTGIVPLKSGEINVNNGEVTGGKFVMDIANMQVAGPKGSDSTSNTKLLGHLKSADFFDVSQHPDGTFELTSVKPYTGEALKDTTDPRQDEINEYKVTNPTHLVSG